MKVKYIAGIYGYDDFDDIDIDELSKYSDFEKRINDFIKDKQVIDIKYQSNVSMAASQGISGSDYERSVLIMYEENKNK